MALAFLTLLAVPSMPYLKMEILREYLGTNTLNALELVEQMYILHGMPGSTNLFGHEHYELITLMLMIMGIVLIVLPVLLEGISMVLIMNARTKGRRKAGICFSVLTVLFLAACLAVFLSAGRFVGVTTRAGYGLYTALGSSVLFALAAVWNGRKQRNQNKKH